MGVHAMRRVIITASFTIGACVAEQPPSELSASGGSGDDGIPITIGGSSSDTDPSASSQASVADSNDDEPIFDVGEGDGTQTGVDTNPTVGSCRSSEVYGAAGGYPAYNDPAYASFID